jgi:hypothetical protein
MNKKVFLLFSLSLFCTILCAQEIFWYSPAAYLGQQPPCSKPVKFAPQLINDTPFFSLDRCAFSRDGREFYYCRNNTWFSTKDATVQVYKYDGSRWNGPTIMIKQQYAPTFSPGGDTLYFIGGGKGGVEQIHRTAGGWTEPATYIKRSYGMYDFMPTLSGNIYAASNINGSVNDYSCYDVCIMKPPVSGDTSIHTLGRPINTPGFDGDFFVAPDESYIIISAKEQPDFECELFISYHKKDGSWTNPKSLGPEINNGPAHRWGEYVPPGNKFLFYSYGHGPQDCALYWVRFDKLLEDLKHTNFEPYVKDSIATQAGVVGNPFFLKIKKGTFYDDDEDDILAYSASQNNGSPLPAWLKFNVVTKTFSGTPPAAGAYHIKLMATDKAKAMASCTFLLKVDNR